MSSGQATIRLMTISQGLSHPLARQSEFTIPMHFTWSQCLIKIHRSLVTLRFEGESAWRDESLLEVWDWKLCEPIYVSETGFSMALMYDKS
jgi:hypothetical protein